MKYDLPSKFSVKREDANPKSNTVSWDFFADLRFCSEICYYIVDISTKTYGWLFRKHKIFRYCLADRT